MPLWGNRKYINGYLSPLKIWCCSYTVSISTSIDTGKALLPPLQEAV